MENELKILELADYYKKFEYKSASGYLIVNNKMEEYKCMFGFIEFPENLEVAQNLFTMIEEEAKSLGFNKLIGPINYCTWMNYRWATNMFDYKLYPDCNNPAYYIDYIEKLGYHKLYTYRSATIDINNSLYAIGETTYKAKLEEGYRFELFEDEEILKKAKEVYEVSVDAFKDTILYSELDYEYFSEIYMSWIKGVKGALYIAYFNGEPVGYVFGYINPYDNSFISKTSAVKKSYQNNKVYVALLYLGAQYVKNKSYDTMIYHFQCEQKSTFKNFESNIEANEKKYAVYVKDLSI